MEIKQNVMENLMLILYLILWQSKEYFQFEYGYRLQNESFNILDVASQNFCKKQCAYRTKCLSLNYNRRQKQCELNSNPTLSVSSLVTDENFDYVEKSELLNAPFVEEPCLSTTCPMNHMCVVLKSNISTCVLTECEEPPPVDNGLMLDTTRAVAKTISYTCNNGYSPIGNTSITCKANGKWTSRQFECRKCVSPPNLSHASVSAPSTLVGSKAIYTCNTGYYMSGPGYITCLSGAVWSTVIFQCNIKNCQTPSTVSYSTRQYTGTTYLSTVTYSCNTGYDMSGSNSRTCLSTGVWSSVLFQCDPRDCGTPPSFSYGYPSYSSTTYGSTVTYYCNSGKTMRGSNSIQCQSSGSWSSTSAYCGCGSLPSADAAHISSGSYQIGSSRSYSCSKSSYTCSGDGHIYCQSSGSWTSPTCSCIFTIISFGR